MPKALFFDIDGTLLSHGTVLPASTVQALNLVKQAGHKVIICTGRSAYQLPPAVMAYADGFVSSTGAYVEAAGTVLSEHFFTLEQVQKILDFFADDSGYMHFQTENHPILTEDALRRTHARFANLGRPENIIEQLTRGAVLPKTLADYQGAKKTVFFDCQKPLSEIFDRLQGEFDVTALSFPGENTGCGEITGRGINKSYGMSVYINALGIAREDVFAFGDGDNDRDMIAFAAHGVAMGNAIPELKEIADYVTTDIDNNGIWNALRHYGLI